MNLNIIDMEEIKDNLEEKVEKELATKKTEKKKLQWVKGEKAGNVETIEDDDGQWLTFSGGGRISKAIVNEYMMDIAEGTLSKDDLNLTMPVHNPPQKQPPAKKENIHASDSPVATLLNKTSQYAEMIINVAVTVKTPTPSLMNVLRDSFEDEADKEVEEFMMAQIDENSLSEAARTEMKRLINDL
jgi:hypothetical protein